MTAAVRTPDATRCPGCWAPLTATPGCSSCGLPLHGPPAVRLWELDTELLRIEDHRAELLLERSGLLAELRGGASSVSPRRVPAPVPAAETHPLRVQNTLLSLGGLLLAVAALVFTAVTYDRLGAGGRAAVLLALTALAGLAAPRALRRGLGATAETLTAVAVALAALDAYGVRKLGLAGGSDPLAYAAGSAAVLAALTLAYGRLVPVRLAYGAAVLLANLSVPLLLGAREPSTPVASLALAALAATDLAVLSALSTRLRPGVRVVLCACALTATGAGLLLTLAQTPFDGQQPGRALPALALVAHAAVLAGAGALVRDRTLQLLLQAAPVLVLTRAAYDATAPELTQEQAPLVLAAVALLVVQAATLLPRPARSGPVLGALVVTGGALAAVGRSAVTGVLLPLTWTVDPWSLPAGASARQAAGAFEAWDGTLVTTLVLAAAGVVLGVAGRALGRLRRVAAPAAVLLTGSAVLLPLGLALTYPAALAVLLLLSAALLTGGVLAPPAWRAMLLTGGAGLSLLAAAWSLADQGATLATVAVAAVLLAGAASGRTGSLPFTASALTALALTASAAALATGELAAVGAARGLSAEQVGGLLLVAVAGGLAGAAVLALSGGPPRARALALEAVAGAAGLVAAGLAVHDPGWLSWVLAGCAVAALATALRPDRRSVAVAGGLLLSASSWVRLADAGVTAPEPYVLPLAAVALTLGHLRRRGAPATRSWQAYGPGLSVLLLPSLLASIDDDGLTRSLLVGAAALVVLLVGARARLQAPLAVGALVLAVDALQLLGPVAAALPRFASLGAAGTLLLVVGATYEQRLREAIRLRACFDALA